MKCTDSLLCMSKAAFDSQRALKSPLTPSKTVPVTRLRAGYAEPLDQRQASRVVRLIPRVVPECRAAAAVAFLFQPGSKECSDAQTKLHWYGNCGGDLGQHHHGGSCVRWLEQLRLPFLRILCASCLQLRAL